MTVKYSDLAVNYFPFSETTHVGGVTQGGSHQAVADDVV